MFIADQVGVIGMFTCRINRGVVVAEQQRLIPGFAAFRGDIRCSAPQRRSIADGAVVHPVLAGQQAAARRAAGGDDGKVLIKADGVLLQRAHVWQVDMFGQSARQAIRPHLINYDEKDFAVFAIRRHVPPFALFVCASHLALFDNGDGRNPLQFGQERNHTNDDSLGFLLNRQLAGRFSLLFCPIVPFCPEFWWRNPGSTRNLNSVESFFHWKQIVFPMR